ncbi:hypothetical protein L9F63_011802 [Diploptera punctata]|uniref:LITAF domain-containing protein n=1 Tax=Diploptera punctata TaxID=6984 RepID=A0AAD8AEW2_DIPPU|nr:hypothetical protein L9F63_011802 [Diploptera punctata]
MVRFGRNRNATPSTNANVSTANQPQGGNVDNSAGAVVTDQPPAESNVPTTGVPPSYSYEGLSVPGPSPYGPPPPYAERDGEYRIIITNIRNGGSYLDFHQSGPVLCPHCMQFTVARVGYRYSAVAYISACLLCLGGCCLCFWIPFCMESCMEARYYCSFCGHYLGFSHMGGPLL